MTKSRVDSSEFAELRRQAEAKLEREVPDFPDCSPEEAQSLVYELRTHQVELELQNAELRRAQEELVEERDKYSHWYDFAPVGYLTISIKGLILEANIALSTMLSIARQSVLKQRLSAFIVPDDQDNYYAHWRMVTETRQRCTCQLRLLKRDAEPIWVELDSILVEAAGERDAQIRAVARDITERKLAEEELRLSGVGLRDANRRLKASNFELTAANRELESFALSVAHDLRTPLRAIDGFGRALLDDYQDRLDETGKSYLDRVRAGAQRLGSLIDDLLELSRLTRAVMNHQSVDLGDLARRIAGDLQTKHPERHVDFVFAPGITAVGDRALLYIALECLLANSWKFTDHREHATIELGVAEQNGDRVFYVRDDGAGFDMTYVDKLFGAFQRLHDAAEFPGSGVGLAIVQRVIQRHGGRVWAEGEVGKGATFHFTIPNAAIENSYEESAT